ncbi:MFS transporter [Streptomyces sp. HNM0575]|uniref:MFS transporter n=1 Tax=Streptomyces sp. HNM0575 TaxID=2716338 RepID=UPI0019CFE621|nr:MFS transporter [Streptomyces sp. HNM0575]
MPLLGVLGVPGVLWAACVLVIAERVGKAMRSPAKDSLLSYTTAATGRGRGFAVHEALDQAGALAGPLAVAGVLAVSGGRYGPALGMLALPGAAVPAVLVWLRVRVPDPAGYEWDLAASPRPPGGAGCRGVPGRFWHCAASTAATTAGLVTFGVLSFYLVHAGLLATALVPVLYAAAMGVDALVALTTGWAYDRVGARVLPVLPLLTAAVPALAFNNALAVAATGWLVWGTATGVQESTLRAVVVDLVPVSRRGTAYGIFASVVGAAILAGGALTGALYEHSVPLLVGVVVALQAVASAWFVVAKPR